MTEVESPIKIDTFRRADQHAKKRRREVSDGFEEPLLPKVAVPPDIFNKIFTIQGQVEKAGAMDYHEYARRMWQEFAGEEIPNGAKGFRQFEKGMILGLHNIEMSDLIFPSLIETMPGFVEKYGDDIESISIWSLGDVKATGYQPGKIRNSRIIEKFFKALPKGSRTEYVKEKTSYLVDDNKLGRFAEVAEELLQKDPEKKVKAVIIEDNTGNFTKARKALDERLGPESEKVEINPIWFTGSRDGLRAQKKVDDLKGSGNMEEYEREKAQLEAKKKDLNAISSFTKLLNQDRFGGTFKGSHVFIDFDGVVCDNIEMRKRQADVVFNSLVNGIHIQTGQNAETISRNLIGRLNGG